MAAVVPDSLEAKLTANQAAGIAGVSVATIRQWASRGYVTPDGDRNYLKAVDRNEHNHPLYRLIDVAKAERATRERARRTWQQAG